MSPSSASATAATTTPKPQKKLRFSSWKLLSSSHIHRYRVAHRTWQLLIRIWFSLPARFHIITHCGNSVSAQCDLFFLDGQTKVHSVLYKRRRFVDGRHRNPGLAYRRRQARWREQGVCGWVHVDFDCSCSLRFFNAARWAYLQESSTRDHFHTCARDADGHVRRFYLPVSLGWL